MTPEQAAALRKPFPSEFVRKLPRLSCQDCSRAQGRVCAKHVKSWCDDCKNTISRAHLHLDYVDHAAVTDRLLQVDPEWTWAPLGKDPTGAPFLDPNQGLWIALTVAGVTRIGYGDAEGKRGADAVKEAISTGIRNAAMRFGVALDLWSKVDLHAHPDAEADPEPEETHDETVERVAAAMATPPAESPEAAPQRNGDADKYREALLVATTKKDVLGAMRALEMDRLGDVEVGDADGAAITLRDLAQRRLKEVR